MKYLKAIIVILVAVTAVVLAQFKPREDRGALEKKLTAFQNVHKQTTAATRAS